MILLKHGIFTFGSTAREAYDRMIDLVSLAEASLAAARRTIVAAPDLPDATATAAQVAPILRGLTGRFIMEFRTGQDILGYVNGAELDRYGRSGVVTPDHVIRTKPWPLILTAGGPDELASFAATARDAVEQYVTTYRDYFDRHSAGQKPLDPMPRVVLVRGLGMFALGNSARSARVAADVTEASMNVIAGAESIGRFESITEAETFQMEYWSLEQAKLGKAVERPLARHIVVITGGAGTIGLATAVAFMQQGAEVALLDLDEDKVAGQAAELGCLGLACDVTDATAVDAAFDRICETYGGIDIVVSNAGGAWQGRIGEVDDDLLRRSFELNFFAHQNVARSAVAIMRAQGFGGSLLFNVSKQAVQPGPGFGPYGLPKAATMALMRQYAVDHGSDGIRSNGVNADRIRSGMVNDELITARAEARNVTEAEYMTGNLLGREVTAADVAGAFVTLALSGATTGAIITVDGGNIAAAMR
jgi:NAD(P)-dependent dehydrogenase (short-subunit alcohol dehydrogenase family)/ribulose-5-phosphate 4-epimerase/fuculose-1-phosphate aldolase